ncbi:MAG: HEAT repeat domain-containing protein [Candidatus Nealsonbacteria bacterium]|nr:HEAT repeat domain-containing protein [Candidatus Nealsonbacteria bacterium]
MAKDPLNLDPIDVPDPNAPPQPAPQPAPANNQAQPPQPVARPLIARIRGLSMTNWLIAGLIVVVLVGLVINFKKTPSETNITTTVEKTKIEETKEFKAEAEKLKAESEKLKIELEMAKALKPLRDEVQKLTEKRQAEVGMTAREALISGQSRLGPEAGSRPVRKPAPPATVESSESLYSLPRLPKIRKGDLSTEDLAAEVSQFTGAAVPALVSYKNEEEAVATDSRVGWLVATMCSNAPADRRVKAAQELSYHPSKGVAQALSFTIGGGRLRTLDQFASVREAATISLGEVGDITFLPLLVQRSKDDPSPEVRKAAYDAAEKIKARASE